MTYLNLRYLLIIVTYLLMGIVSAYGQPWRSPLRISESADGTSFHNDRIFQDSSGVPSLIRLPSGVLICAFQWFRQPVGSPSWDRVAVKFSSDNGLYWTEPQPITINGLPVNFTRPFDPALSINDSGKIRMFFSCGLNMILDTSINTYSAVSDDGIVYTMDSGIRFSMPDRPVLDPAVIKFNGLWHLVNPITGGGTGAYHNISNDGFNFTRVPDIPSDMNHSWIGNFLIKDANELRFYGSGMGIWYSSSSNGGVWSGFVPANVTGGDPSVLKLSDNNYMMVYTGPQYPVSVQEYAASTNSYKLFQNYPNPFNPETNLEFIIPELGMVTLKVFDAAGKLVKIIINEMRPAGDYKLRFDGSDLPGGIYFYRLQMNGYTIDSKRMILLK